jgi:hypothetical protein
MLGRRPPTTRFCHRQNRFTSAAGWMSTVLTNSGPASECSMEAEMVLAMSHLQHAEQARAALAAGAAIDQELGRLDSGNIGKGWIDWIIAHALMSEAKALIEGNAKAGDHPK